MTKNILIIDDEQNARVLIQEMLSPQGYEVLAAFKGAEGLREAEEQTPDLVLLDVEMPEMDGFDVLRRIRETPTTAAIPVVMLTARSIVEGEPLAMKLGSLHYIPKPYRRDWLTSTVRVASREAEAG